MDRVLVKAFGIQQFFCYSYEILFLPRNRIFLYPKFVIKHSDSVKKSKNLFSVRSNRSLPVRMGISVKKRMKNEILSIYRSIFIRDLFVCERAEHCT